MLGTAARAVPGRRVNAVGGDMHPYRTVRPTWRWRGLFRHDIIPCIFMNFAVSPDQAHIHNPALSCHRASLSPPCR